MSVSRQSLCLVHLKDVYREHGIYTKYCFHECSQSTLSTVRSNCGMDPYCLLIAPSCDMKRAVLTGPGSRHAGNFDPGLLSLALPVKSTLQAGEITPNIS